MAIPVIREAIFVASMTTGVSFRHLGMRQEIYSVTFLIQNVSVNVGNEVPFSAAKDNVSLIALVRIRKDDGRNRRV